MDRRNFFTTSVLGTTSIALSGQVTAQTYTNGHNPIAEAQGIVTPRMFGAKADGEDDSSAFNEFLSYIAENGGIGFIEKGRYSVSDLVISGDDWKIQGEKGAVLSQRKGGKNVITASGNRWCIDGIEIDGNMKGNYGKGENGEDNDSITMLNGDVGILVGQCSDAAITNCEIHDCTNLGIGVRTPTLPFFSRRIRIENNHIYAIGERKEGPLVGGRGGNCLAVGDTAKQLEPTILEPIIKNNIMHNSHSTLISLGSCDDFQCVGNVVYDGDSNGIQVGTSSRNGIIDGNMIRNLTGYANPDIENRGISVHPSSTIEKQIMVRNNHIISAQLYGIDVRVPGMIVSNNIIVNLGDQYKGDSLSGLAGIAVFVGSAVIEGNQIIASEGNGILCFVNNVNLSSMVISSNRCQSTAKTGIVFNRAFGGSASFEQPVITGNIIDGTHDGSGISLSACNRATVSNNLVKNATIGFNITEYSTECLFNNNSAIGSKNKDIFVNENSSVKLGLHNEYTTSNLEGEILAPPNPVAIPEYSTSALPSAETFRNHIIIVLNDSGGRTIATSDGKNWLSVSDGDIVS